VRSVPRNLQWSFFCYFPKQAQRSLWNFRLPYKFMFWRSNGWYSSSQRSLQVLLRPVLFGHLTDFAGNDMILSATFFSLCAGVQSAYVELFWPLRNWERCSSEWSESIYFLKPNYGKNGQCLIMIISSISRWWFQIFFIFTPTWGRFPI